LITLKQTSAVFSPAAASTFFFQSMKVTPLIQCQVSSAVAAAMLAPLKGTGAGQFRPLPGNLVEIDASVTLAVATQMVEAKAAAESRLQLH
jgi:hypothetical protein